MDQVEQWFSILQRKRLAIADFADKAAVAERLQSFVQEWNEHASGSVSYFPISGVLYSEVLYFVTGAHFG